MVSESLVVGRLLWWSRGWTCHITAARRQRGGVPSLPLWKRPHRYTHKYDLQISMVIPNPAQVAMEINHHIHSTNNSIYYTKTRVQRVSIAFE